MHRSIFIHVLYNIFNAKNVQLTQDSFPNFMVDCRSNSTSLVLNRQLHQWNLRKELQPHGRKKTHKIQNPKNTTFCINCNFIKASIYNCIFCLSFGSWCHAGMRAAYVDLYMILYQIKWSFFWDIDWHKRTINGRKITNYLQQCRWWW